MTRPRLVDLFCGAGGCSVGYHRAGFDVVGVDLHPQPNYPFEFHQADALEFSLDGFDAIHASPPCQAYSTQGRSSRWGQPPSSPPLIPQVRDRLVAAGVPYVIENVAGARRHLREPVIELRGPDFGLDQIVRLRLFELGGWWTLQPNRSRRPDGLVLGVYGERPDGRALKTTVTKERLRAPTSIDEAAGAMGIDWCPDWRGIAEAIPPAYCEWIGAQLLEAMERAA